MSSTGRKYYKHVRKRRKRKSTRKEPEYARGPFTTQEDREEHDSLIEDRSRHGWHEEASSRARYPVRDEKRGSRIIEVERTYDRRGAPIPVTAEDEIIVITEPEERRGSRSRRESRNRVIEREYGDVGDVVVRESDRREDRRRYSERMNERFRDEGYEEGGRERERDRERYRSRVRDGEFEGRVRERRDGSRYGGGEFEGLVRD